MDDTPNNEAYEPDEIDYFLNLQEAQEKSMGASGTHSAGLEWASFKRLCISASSLVLRHYATLPLKRVSYLLRTKRELEKDRQWPRSSEPEKRSTAGLMSPVQEIVLRIYRSEGLRGFFRGARLSAVLSMLTMVEAILVMKLFLFVSKVLAAPLMHNVSMPLSRKLGSATFAKVFWWGVVPTAIWAARWPLRSIRTILMTTYLSGGVFVVGEDAHGNDSGISQETQAHGKNGEESKLHHRPESQSLTYTQLWKRIRTDCSWWDILVNGWEVDLADYITSIILGEFTKACTALTPAVANVSFELAPWLFLSPAVTYDVLRISLSIAVTVVETAVWQPLLVLSRRMALLSPRIQNFEENQGNEEIHDGVADRPTKRKKYPSRRVGRRYRSTWECVTYILHNEGWRSFFDGISFNLIVQIVLLGFNFVRQRFMVL